MIQSTLKKKQAKEKKQENFNRKEGNRTIWIEDCKLTPKRKEEKEEHKRTALY